MSKNGVFGIKEVNKALEDLAPKHANNIAKSVMHSLAAEVAKKAKMNTPENTGNLKKAIKAKRRRGKPGKPVSDVIITQGKAQKNDGFYWRFVEFGTSGKTGQPEQSFLRPAMDNVVADMPSILKEQLIKKVAAAAKRELKKARKE